jgi:DNA-3-methyladenine glycosylase
MFGEAGIFYVYLVYGMYYMLNVVTGKKGHPGAVLVRRIERLKDSNIERSGEKKNGINGPGKVTKFLNIDKKLNGLPAIPKTGIWFECSDKKFKIKKAKRIGVTYAGPVWSNKLWRFLYQS